MVVLYLLSLAPLAIVLKQLEVGAVYAIWSALGTVAVAVLGMLLFHEPPTAMKVISMVLIIAGVVGLNLSGGAPGDMARSDRQPTSAEWRNSDKPPVSR